MRNSRTCDHVNGQAGRRLDRGDGQAIETANRKTGISFEEMGKKMSAMVADQIQKQQMLGGITDKTTEAMKKQDQTTVDMVKGMSALGKATVGSVARL